MKIVYNPYMKTYVYRIYPAKSQIVLLERQLEFCRQVYNSMLSDKKAHWENEHKTLSAFDLIKTLPRRKLENPELKLVYSDVLQNLGLRLEKAFTGFFSRIKRIENPRFFEIDQKQLAKAQRNEKRKAIQKIHKRIFNRRQNFAHTESAKLIKNYDILCIEDLSVNKMLAKRWCSKQISDVAWADFLSKLTYKAENAGKKVVKVNPAYTSQTCSKCHTITNHKLSQDTFSCPNCGYADNRDLNAAQNILRLGLQSLACLEAP